MPQHPPTVPPRVPRGVPGDRNVRSAALAEPACAPQEFVDPHIPGSISPQEATEQVVREYGPRVYGLAWRMLGNGADAEDVAQEVLLQVVRRLDTFRGESSLATWLYRITINAALALRRRRAIQRERPLTDPMSHFLPDGRHARPIRAWSCAPDEQTLSREQRELIEAAIARLPTMYRDVYVLSDIEGLQNADIGEALGLSLPAVKSRLHRARLMLRESLAAYFEEKVS